MNFADQLINWRNSDIEITNCEKFVVRSISNKCEEISDFLKKLTPSGKIRMIKYGKRKFIKSVIEIVNWRYHKNIDPNIISGLFSDKLKLYDNVYEFFDSSNIKYNDEGCIIFYANNITPNKDVFYDLIEHWFYEYVLKNFETEYKLVNTNNCILSSDFISHYSYAPIINIAEKLGYTLEISSEFLNKLADLAHKSGLVLIKVDKGNTILLALKE